MTHRHAAHAAHAAIRNPADGLLHFSAARERWQNETTGRSPGSQVLMRRLPARSARIAQGDATVSFQWLAVFEKPP